MPSLSLKDGGAEPSDELRPMREGQGACKGYGGLGWFWNAFIGARSRKP